MAIASVGTLGTGANAGAAGASFTFNTATNTLSAGDQGILVVVSDNIATVDGASSNHTTPSMSPSGVWEKLGEYTNSPGGVAADGVTVSAWKFHALAAVATGTTVTVNFSGSVTDACCSFWKFTVAAGKTLVLDTAPGTNPITSEVNAANGFGSSAFSGLSSSERLYFRALGKEANSTTALTNSASFTIITAQRSRNNSAAQLVRGEFRINTSTGETSNPTMAVTGDTAGLFISLVEATAVPTLTNATVASITSTGGTPKVDTDKASGTVYYTITSSGGFGSLTDAQKVEAVKTGWKVWGDASFSSTKLIALQENGANNSTSFTDQSGSARALTALGNAKWTTANPPTGLTSSLICDGQSAPSNTEVTGQDSADFSVGSGAFTAETNIYPTSATFGNFLTFGCGGTTDLSFQLQYGGDNHIYVFMSSGGVVWTDISEGDLSSSGTVSLNNWHHIAVTRSGNTFTLWVDGASAGTLTSSAALHSVSTTSCGGNRSLQIGSSAGGDTQNFVGQIAGTRVTKGVARYTAAFTPPSLPMATSGATTADDAANQAVSGTGTQTLTVASHESASTTYDVWFVHTNSYGDSSPASASFTTSSSGGATSTVGSVSGVSTLSGVTNTLKNAKGVVTGSGVALGTTNTVINTIGNSTGLATAAGVFSSTQDRQTVGTTTGTGTALGVSNTVANSVGVTNGAGTAVGVTNTVTNAVGNSVGTVSVVGVGQATQAGQALGTSNGIAAVSGVANTEIYSAGNSSGTSDAQGVNPQVVVNQVGVVISSAGGELTWEDHVKAVHEMRMLEGRIKEQKKELDKVVRKIKTAEKKVRVEKNEGILANLYRLEFKKDELENKIQALETNLEPLVMFLEKWEIDEDDDEFMSLQ